MPTALLTFDVEEFDLPCECGAQWPSSKQFEVGRAGWERLLNLLAESRACATLFTTASIAAHSPDLLNMSARSHEIASHGLTHGPLNPGDLRASRVQLESLGAGQVLGFRRARMAPTDPAEILSAGYLYDSSIHPIWLPGRYDNRSLPRSIHKVGDLVEVPASATPRWRLPVFWLAMKHYPVWLYRDCVSRCLERDGYANIYMHPWEFLDLRGFPIPAYTRRPCGKKLSDRVQEFIEWLRPRAELSTLGRYLSSQSLITLPASTHATGTT